MKRTGLGLLIGLVIVVVVVIALLVLRSGQKGHIRIDTPNIRTSMRLSRGWWSELQVSSDGEPVKVAASTYRPRQISVTGAEGENEWVISGSGPWGKLSKIDVKKQQTVSLKPGPPLSVKTDVRSRRPVSSIGLSLIGQAGEYYSPRVRTRKGSVAAPSVKIVDENGKVLASGKFRFG